MAMRMYGIRKAPVRVKGHQTINKVSDHQHDLNTELMSVLMYSTSTILQYQY